jgi:translation elongation factor EF-Ts
MTKAKEALQKSGLVLEDALAWLEADLAQGGAAKQRKVASRIASEGLIAVGCMGEGWGKRGGIVEVRSGLFSGGEENESEG